MKAPITELLSNSFDQAARRGIPASEIIPHLATKFNLRTERVIESLLASDHIQLTEFCGATILWHAKEPKNANLNANIQRQISADLLQASVNFGLANGVLKRQSLQSQAPEKIFSDLIPQILTADHNPQNITGKAAKTTTKPAAA